MGKGWIAIGYFLHFIVGGTHWLGWLLPILHCWVERIGFFLYFIVGLIIYH